MVVLDARADLLALFVDPVFWIGASVIALMFGLVIIWLMMRMRRKLRALQARLDRPPPISVPAGVILGTAASVAAAAAPTRMAEMASAPPPLPLPSPLWALSGGIFPQELELTKKWARHQLPEQWDGQIDDESSLISLSTVVDQLAAELDSLLADIGGDDWTEVDARIARSHELLDQLKQRKNAAAQYLQETLLPDARHADCSVFAPPLARRGQQLLIQVLLHSKRDLIKAAKLAARLDPTANRRAFSTLDVELDIGAEVELFIECPTIGLHEPVGSVVWDGEPVSFSCKARVPKDHPDAPIVGTLHVSVEGIPVGEIEFSISLAEKKAAAGREPNQVAVIGFTSDQRSVEEAMKRVEKLELAPTRSTKFERVFVSYARKDFELVSFFAQGLEERGMSPVVDVTALEPGDEWGSELPTLIEAADVVYVMWSDHAAASRWVDIETKHAVSIYDRQKGARPKIKPIPLHQPWPQAPDHLSRFHFALKWQSHRTAQKLGLTHQAHEGPLT